jgi:tetratricopeptide (TPR) repeat protein
MPTSVLDVLDAYRTDLAAASRSDPFGERDQTWILFGSTLQRAVTLPADARDIYLSAALSQLLSRGANSSSSDVASAVEAYSEEAEDAGAYALALVILDLGRGITPLVDVRQHGRFVARQARIHRKLGELDTALDLYEEVEASGLQNHDEELVCRGRLGKGIAARMRGNYPLAERFFRAVLESGGTSAAIREIKALAHHGMMIVAGVAKHYGTALQHGWMAYDLFAEWPARQSDMLVEISNVCNYTGQYRAALNGYLLVLGHPIVPRLRLTAIGGAALAAAHLGDAAVVHRLAAEGSAMIDPRNDQYEVADLERALAEAFYWLGEVRQGDTFKERATKRAIAGGYFEIVHEAESLGPVGTIAKRDTDVLSVEASAFTSKLAVRDSHDLLAAAFSRSD